MKERPILMSAPMVRALLDGSKTQTRRVCKDQEGISFMAGDQDDPDNEGPGLRWGQLRDDDGLLSKPQWLAFCFDYLEEGAIGLGTAYGQAGDRLWVRETYAPEQFDLLAESVAEIEATLNKPAYRADWDATPTRLPAYKWKPSIFMPRAASRITLEVTSVRVERLQDISEADAMAEGLTYKNGLYATPDQVWQIDPRKAYRDLWEVINGPGSWDANPWVWVVEFKRITP